MLVDQSSRWRDGEDDQDQPPLLCSLAPAYCPAGDADIIAAGDAMSTIKENAKLYSNKPQYYRLVISSIEEGIARTEWSIVDRGDKDGFLAQHIIELRKSILECEEALKKLLAEPI